MRVLLNYLIIFFIGYKANYHKRPEKAGGSIKIAGACPSKLQVKFFENGKS